ncbi:MAG: hypothetical protein VX403_00625 [Planctomycetota bacterium]|nr:hypothetical protein [Planctomycetota bacterium]MEC8734834.1 hypothetical protein [Planctomycetota bacterium]MEC8817907.1 hypothetical protein [Planctomycetota bacterium]MEC9158282.1 hypothetical protein [Planctomycetota bacterium]MEC9232394.1 hypothetical protein [Planctomycetota bacterium]
MTQSPLGQFGTGSTVKREAPMDVYTGLLLAAFVVLLVGFIAIAMANMTLVEGEQGQGGLMDSLPGFMSIKSDS